MPPDVQSSPALVASQSRPPLPPKSDLNLSDSNRFRQSRRMDVIVTRKRLVHSLVFVLACMSVFRLLRFAATSYASSARSTWAEFSKACNLSDSDCREISTPATSPYPRSKPITKKEFRFLSSIISKKAPCNVLVFGWETQYRHLSKINPAGKTVFLEDAPERIRRLRRANNTRIYKVKYSTKAKEAYKLLKYAREEPACAANNVDAAEKSTCQLTLLGLPDDVYRIKWDVILVDGPSSDGPEDPGRMTTIYTSGLIARGAENSTANVVIHDVDRIIEKWYSREFLCENNLVSSKGRFWNFKIKGGERFESSKFCS
ncbi:hypothetical protein vseg_013697 [Gypsophila vaccaria]